VRKYLHIGDSIVLSCGDIIGIFKKSPENSIFTGWFEKNFAARNISDKNKSFILTGRRSKMLIYYSKISPKRLYKRTHDMETGGING
jgi:hypothetical protein